MTDAGRTRTIVIAVIALASLAALVGVVALLGDDEPVPAIDNESPTAIARWCEDLTEGLEPRGPFGSFEQVVEAAIAGRLKRPTDDPPLRDEARYRAWQEAHEEYLASSYLQLLESTPKPMVFTAAAFAVTIADGHLGAPPEDPRAARRDARALDRFHRRHC